MFGERLHALRTEHGYSMDYLAELYNNKYNGKLNKSTISRYENGLQEPMLFVVKNLAELFSVSVDYLTGEERPTPVSESGPSNPIIARIVESLDLLSPDQLETIAALTDTLRRGKEHK